MNIINTIFTVHKLTQMENDFEKRQCLELKKEERENMDCFIAVKNFNIYILKGFKVNLKSRGFHMNSLHVLKKEIM